MTEYYDARLGVARPEGRYRTHAQERAEEKAADIPLAGQFSVGDHVTVDPAWKKHWTFKEAPKPTRGLWAKLFTQVGVVDAVDSWGNVYVQDRFDQMHGGHGFPVPARFVHHVTREN